MSDEFLKIWSFDDSVGEYVLPHAKTFFVKQKQAYPTMTALYKHQMELVKAEHPNVLFN